MEDENETFAGLGQCVFIGFKNEDGTLEELKAKAHFVCQRLDPIPAAECQHAPKGLQNGWKQSFEIKFDCCDIPPMKYKPKLGPREEEAMRQYLGTQYDKMGENERNAWGLLFERPTHVIIRDKDGYDHVVAVEGTIERTRAPYRRLPRKLKKKLGKLYHYTILSNETERTSPLH